VATLRFAVPDVAAQRAFWDKVASWLGWTPARSPDGTAAYAGAGLGLVFTPGAPAAASAPAPVTLTLEAPSPAAVIRLKDLLQAQHPRSIVSGPGEGLKFQDPAGLMWEYASPPV
ncbi:VOC family protein, partial [Corallococcus llansteffanensis]|uniref:VOC family protein n=1 Tax=Corallococcus llansteffanensis TaxID=2316731 RepID=UPI00142E983E